MSNLKSQAFKPMIQQSGLVHDICKPLFDASGLTHFSYVELYEDGAFSAICNNSHKYNTLLEHNLGAKVSIDILQRDSLGVYITDLEEKDFFNQNFKDVFNYFNEAHFLQILDKGERNGRSVIRFYMYGTHYSNQHINHFYINNLAMLKEFNKYFATRMGNFLDCITPVEIQDNLKPGFKALCNRLTSPKEPSLELFSFTNDQPTKKIITKRENQVIKEYMQGLTAMEIAEALHISYRTVERHLDNIRDKLGCRSRRQIFSKLIELGYNI